MNHNKNIKVLVVDDEPKILDAVQSYLKSLGYSVYTAENGTKALEIFNNVPISFVLLDLMLPDISGEEICMKIRQQSRVPIIMLTAKIEEEDMLEGLNTGADDYITKPFSLRELSTRMDAILRRVVEEPVPLFNEITINNGDLTIMFDKHIIKKKNVDVLLTPNEFNILASLIKYPDKVFTREELIEIALGSDYSGFDRAIDSHIKNLRKKIETNPKKPDYIKTVHGIGYKFGVSTNEKNT